MAAKALPKLSGCCGGKANISILWELLLPPAACLPGALPEQKISSCILSNPACFVLNSRTKRLELAADAWLNSQNPEIYIDDDFLVNLEHSLVIYFWRSFSQHITSCPKSQRFEGKNSLRLRVSTWARNVSIFLYWELLLPSACLILQEQKISSISNFNVCLVQNWSKRYIIICLVNWSPFQSAICCLHGWMSMGWG